MPTTAVRSARPTVFALNAELCKSWCLPSPPGEHHATLFAELHKEVGLGRVQGLSPSFRPTLGGRVSRSHADSPYFRMIKSGEATTGFGRTTMPQSRLVTARPTWGLPQWSLVLLPVRALAPLQHCFQPLITKELTARSQCVTRMNAEYSCLAPLRPPGRILRFPWLCGFSVELPSGRRRGGFPVGRSLAHFCSALR